MALTKVTGELVDIGDLDISNVGSIQLDSIAGDADSNTSITFSGSDVITVATGGSTAATFNADQTTTFSGAISGTSATLTTADNTAQLTLISTDTDSGIGPILDLKRNPNEAGADADWLGQIHFTGHNDAGTPEDIVYAKITGQIDDASDGTEDATVRWYIMQGGTRREALSLGPSETVVNEASVDKNFRVESDGNANMLFVDGGEDRVGIGSSSPDCTLHINGSANSEQVIITGNGNASRGLSISTAANGGQQDAHVIFNAQDTGHADYPMMTFQTGGTERMRIQPAGHVNIGIGGSGGDLILQPLAKLYLDAGGNTYIQESAGDVIDIYTGGTRRLRINSDGLIFNADTAAANALDDYEEGTFTPSYTVAGGGSVTGVSSTNVGTYTKIGNMVTVAVRSHYVQTTGTIPTAYNMTLPFQAKNNGGLAGFGVGNETGQTGKSMFISIDGNATTCVIKAKDGGAPPANAYLDIAFTYQAA